MSYVDDMYENAYPNYDPQSAKMSNVEWAKKEYAENERGEDKYQEAIRENEEFFDKLRAEAKMKTELKDVLQQRGDRYGSYPTHALISQDLKATMQKYSGYERLSVDQKESLEMIAHKIARILNGDPNYDDSWVDIAGYATLISKRLQSENDK